MYFESRGQAGQMLARQLYEHYRYENCAVLALSDGAVLVGEQIAAALHCVIMMLLTEDIPIPGEGIDFGAISQGGNFTYNAAFSDGEIDAYTSEFYGYLSEQKREAFQRINRLIGAGGTVEPSLLKDRVIILVSDGLDGGASLDVALDFLKPIRTDKLVVAAPVAAVNAIDKIHVQADELHILDVRENFLDTNHYYSNNVLPDHEETVHRISEIITKWR
jgi:putative phosphoribosyl transferase